MAYKKPQLKRPENRMITGEQVRASLGALRWTRAQLSEAADIPPRTIQRIAEAEGIPNTQAPTLVQVRKALEAAGVVLIEDQSGRSGVSLAPVPAPPVKPRARRSKASAQ